MNAATLIFPHQLFEKHPSLDKERLTVLTEDSLFFGDRYAPARFHKQKLLLHRASMAAYAEQLARRGYRVEIRRYLPHETARDTIAHLAQCGVRVIHLADPVDFLLEKRLRESAAQHGVRLHIEPSPMFLTDLDWAADVFARKRRYLMADFYQAQRRRLNLLMEGDRPAGGVWSFDAENRKPWPRGLVPPPFPSLKLPARYEQLAIAIEREFEKNPGQTRDFWFPITSAAARRALDDFLERRLDRFGDYEDAISATHHVLFHSVLSPALNIGLLTPQEVLDRALDFARGAGVPLNSLEGFVRQIIGWREFIRVMYLREGTRMRTANFWNHERPMPKAFYDGTTGLDPLDTVIRRVNARAWCHHIERLMVLSNAMLLCGIRPNDAYQWFMELFIDAFDWVMVPNLYDMGIFASGGVFATKPYICGSAYLRRMSDFPRGPWCDTWDALFWSFIGANRDYFAGQYRLSMIARSWDTFGAEKQQALRARAARFLDGLK